MHGPWGARVNVGSPNYSHLFLVCDVVARGLGWKEGHLSSRSMVINPASTYGRISIWPQQETPNNIYIYIYTYIWGNIWKYIKIYKQIWFCTVWELGALAVCKILPRGPLTVSTAGQPILKMWFSEARGWQEMGGLGGGEAPPTTGRPEADWKWGGLGEGGDAPPGS